MIRNGTVIHEARVTTFRNVQSDSEILNVAILAVLTTILSYQLSAIAYNVFFGSKVRGRATASDIHKIILTEVASPLAVFAAIARVDILDQLRFKGEFPQNTRIARRDTHIHPKVTLSLIFLLLIAPVFNLVSIFIVLQRDETLTFSEARFGGLALGVSDVEVTAEPLTPFCGRIPLRIVGQAETVVQFQKCFDFEIFLNNSAIVSQQVRLIAENTAQGQIKVSVVSLPRKIPISTASLVDLISNGKLFRTQPVFGLQDAARLIHEGQNRLAVNCSAAKIQNSPQNENLLKIEEGKGLLKVSKDFNCSLEKVGEFVSVMFNMTKRVTVVQQGATNVTDVEKLDPLADVSPKYFDGGEFRFIVQRSRNVNLLVLLVATCAAVVLRMVTSFLFNNDLDEALQAVVRYRLGLGSHESMLRSTRTVRYDSKGQRGSTAHYGVQRRSIPEVEHFDGAIQVGMEETSTELRSRDEW